jgi:hypothetical protein
MHMAGKQGAGLKLEEDRSAAGVCVEPKLPPSDALPFGLFPGQHIAIDRKFARHEFHRLMR